MKRYRAEVVSKYQPLHADLLDLSKWPFVPSFREAITKGTKEALLSIMAEEAPGLFSFDMFDAPFCELFLEEVDHFEHWCQQNELAVHRPNSMNQYGAILDDFGFERVLNELTRQYMNPLCAAVYPHIGGTLDSHHAFIVEYEIGKDTKLDFHVDDSEFTLNLCLGRRFEGGNLFFGGVRCPTHQTSGILPEEQFEFAHRVGQALIHVGRHRHQAHAITSGQRSNLILWCRSSSFRESFDPHLCPPWCGLHELYMAHGSTSSCRRGCQCDHRRQDEDHGQQPDSTAS